MAMTKKDFIALADVIRGYNEGAFPSNSNIASPLEFEPTQINALADFCQTQNPNFDRAKWLDYINRKE